MEVGRIRPHSVRPTYSLTITWRQLISPSRFYLGVLFASETRTVLVCLVHANVTMSAEIQPVHFPKELDDEW